MTIRQPHLIEALHSANPDERATAAEALCKQGQNASQAMLPLLIACDDEDERVAEWANAALESLGPPAPDTAQSLAQQLSAGSPTRGYWAATLLGRLGAAAQVALPAMIDLLHDEQTPAEVRQQLAWAMGKIGPLAHNALHVLRKTSGSCDARLARLAQTSIEQITQ